MKRYGCLYCPYENEDKEQYSVHMHREHPEHIHTTGSVYTEEEVGDLFKNWRRIPPEEGDC